MSKLIATMPLGGFTKDWPNISAPDFSIQEQDMGELVSLAVKNGEDKAFNRAFKKAYDAAPPAPNHMVDIKGGLAFWTGPEQYMLKLSGENIHADIDAATDLGGAAYATLQSDGWASLHLRGEAIYDVLERFMPLNLRDAPHGFAARTMAHHIAVIILKSNDTELTLLTPRSSALSFLDGLKHTAELYFR